MTMTLNQAGVAVDGILNRDQSRVGTLRRIPLGTAAVPQVARLAPGKRRQAERSGRASTRGLMPSAREDRAESIFLGIVAIGSGLGLGMGLIGAAGFAASWTSFVQVVSRLIG